MVNLIFDILCFHRYRRMHLHFCIYTHAFAWSAERPKVRLVARAGARTLDRVSAFQTSVANLAQRRPIAQVSGNLPSLRLMFCHAFFPSPWALVTSFGARKM
jgi:hypothetical protein